MNVEALVGKVLGTCTLQHIIGRGETGTVYLAQQSRPRRQVAVKVLQSTLPVAPRQRAAVLERIRHEIDIIASLEHPNIIQIHEYGEHHGLAYLVMPHVNGGTLYDEIEQRGPLSLATVVFYLEQIAAALDYAHKRGIVHYSIKPTNILMQRGGRLLLTDFGQLKRRSGTHARMSKGAPTSSSLAYAAPEQALGHEVDTSANLYSLGIILYQMVTGTVPFKAGRAAHHQHIRPQSPRVFRPDLPATAEQVMLKALALQPTDRYQHVQEFSGAFREALIMAGIPLADLGSMFISAGLSDPRIPVPQQSLEIKQQPASPTRSHKSPKMKQQQPPAMDLGDSNVLIDLSPTLHLLKKNGPVRHEDDGITTDELPTIHLANKHALALPEGQAPIDTSPAIQQVHKDMLNYDQDDSSPSPDTSSDMRAISTKAHQHDIVARTHLALPSLTSFLPSFPHSQSSIQEKPLTPAAERPVAGLEACLSPDTPESHQLNTTASIQATSTTEASPQSPARTAPQQQEPDASWAAFVEQAATIPPLNRSITSKAASQTKQEAAVSQEPHTVFSIRKKTASGAKAPARRASLLFLVGIVALVILLLGTFAYTTSGHGLLSGAALSSRHSSPEHTNTNFATTLSSKPGSKSFHVEENLQLTIEGHNSNVSIRTGTTDTVTVMTSIPGSNPTATNNVTIQYRQTVDKQGRDHLDVAANPLSSGIDYTVTVPATTQVRIRVDAGSIVVDGINGVTISTGGGNLNLAHIHGPIYVYTESGDIIASDIAGHMQMMSVNGSIRANSINGSLQAITRNGDVLVDNATLDGQSILKTTNGSVRFTGTINPLGTYKMITDRGNIDLSLPANTALQLDASTYSGSIENAFGTTITGTAPRASVTISIEDGGSITIHKGATQANTSPLSYQHS